MRLAIALAVLLPALAQERPAAPKPEKLVVHEWGTFTTVSGADGVSLEWRPLSGPSDLPTFVYGTGGRPKGLRHGQTCEGCGHLGCGCGPTCKGRTEKECGCKGCYTATVRMETPVLYFYGDRECVVSVKVDFPKGKVTEWYPQARQVGNGIDWGGVKVMPNASPTYPTEKDPSHYYPARETDAAPVRVCGGGKQEYEKFLFYRGVGTFDLPVAVTLSGNRVVVRNAGARPISHVVLFENRAGKAGFRVAKALSSEVALDRPEPSSKDIGAELQRILVAEGLYEREASAMVKTWRDSWFEEGLRVFYVVPRADTDRVLPLALDPKPTELVRVLVGRVEIITPELEKRIAAEVERLGDAEFEAREEATKELRRLGRFAEPVLKRVLATTDDAEVKARVKKLLEP
jgi:hypothetical protein